MPSLKYTPGVFDLSVKRASAGLGLFANQRIPKGACIIEYTGRPISSEEETKSRSKYLFDLGTGTTIDGQSRSNRARYINHSCAANCEPNIHKGRVFIHALRDIKPGEELGYDYGEAYFKAYLEGKCRCSGCTKKIAKKAAAKTAKKATAATKVSEKEMA